MSKDEPKEYTFTLGSRKRRRTANREQEVACRDRRAPYLGSGDEAHEAREGRGDGELGTASVGSIPDGARLLQVGQRRVI